MMLEDLVFGLGCSVVGPATRVEDAMMLAESETLDGAILDVDLHGRLIYPVVGILQARKVPFVLCSGYAMADRLPPPYDVLPQIAKPYDNGALKKLIEAEILGAAHSGSRRHPSAPA